MLWFKRALCALLLPLILILLAVPITAQESAPTPTGIPVLGGTPAGGNVPSLGNPSPTQIVPETTEEPVVTTEGTPAPTTAPDTVAPTAVTNLNVQAGVCPESLNEAMSVTNLACSDTGTGQACLGQGVVKATPRTATPDFAFDSSSQKVTFSDLSELTLSTLSTDSRLWAVVMAKRVLNTSDGSTAGDAGFLILGDVTLADDGERAGAGARTATVIANFGLNVRRSPDNNGVVVWQLTPGTEVSAIGRTDDQQWIRIIIPNDFAKAAWVYAPYMDVEGGAENLPIATENSPLPNLAGPEFGAMQAFTLLSANTGDDCADAPHSGMMIQSPNGLPTGVFVKVRVNKVRLEINGTVFVQAQASGNLVVDIIEGEARVTANDTTLSGTSISQISVPMGANLEPTGQPTTTLGNLAKVVTLPTTAMPRPFILNTSQLPVENTTATDTTTTTTDTTTQSVAPVTDAGAPPVISQTCTISAGAENRNIRRGAGTEFDVISVLLAGQSTEAVEVVRDANNYPWYKTVDNGFIRVDAVISAPACVGIAPFIVTAESAAPAATAVPAEPTGTAAPPAGASLIASDAGEICGKEAGYSLTYQQPGGESPASAPGNIWQATAGTKIQVRVDGSIVFRTEFGNFLQIMDATNLESAPLAASGAETTLEYTFTKNQSFYIYVIANPGDLIFFKAICAF